MPPLKMPWQPDFSLFLEAISVPGVSGVSRCVLGAHLSFQADGDVQRLDADEAIALWLGFYGKPLLDRNWQPFDQSSPAAYMPLPLSAFEVVLLPSGALLVQRKASRLRLPQQVSSGGGGNHMVHLASSQEEALSAVEQLLHSIGVGAETASTYAGQVLSRLLGNDAAPISREVSSPAASLSP